MSDLLVVLGIAVLAAVVGLGLGIVVIAPRLARVADRRDDSEEPRDRDD